MVQWSPCTRRNTAYREAARKLQVAYEIPIPPTGGNRHMATQLCQKCKQAHPGRVCDYDDKAECAETKVVEGVDQSP